MFRIPNVLRSSPIKHHSFKYHQSLNPNIKKILTFGRESMSLRRFLPFRSSADGYNVLEEPPCAKDERHELPWYHRIRIYVQNAYTKAKRKVSRGIDVSFRKLSNNQDYYEEDDVTLALLSSDWLLYGDNTPNSIITGPTNMKIYQSISAMQKTLKPKKDREDTKDARYL